MAEIVSELIRNDPLERENNIKNEKMDINEQLTMPITDNVTEGIQNEELLLKMNINPDDAVTAKKIASRYERKKTIAHGMMDTALISANANQLNFVITQYYNGNHLIMIILIILILLSLLIQINVGVALIIQHKKRVKVTARNHKQQMNIDDYIIIGVFFVIIINIFIAAFSVGNRK